MRQNSGSYMSQSENYTDNEIDFQIKGMGNQRDDDIYYGTDEMNMNNVKMSNH